MTKAPIVVIGDIILDEYWYGNSERISPEAPVPVVVRKEAVSRLGGAANVALNVKTLEQDVYLMGVMGQDPSSEKIHDLFKQHAIGSGIIQDPSYTTIQKLRILANNHYIGRVDFEEAFTVMASQLLPLLPRGIQWCILSDYGKGTLTAQTPTQQSETQKLISDLNSKKVKVFVDPKADFENYRNSWLIKPNKKEFETFVGRFDSLDDLKQKARQSLAHYNIENMLITLGANGMVLVNKDEDVFWNSQALDVFDVTGAGDTVIATLVSFMAKGFSLVESIGKANQAAAIAVSKKGVYNVRLHELL